METAVASIRAKTKARGVRVERPPAPPSVPATPIRLVSIQQTAGNLAIQKLFDSGQRKSQESSISPPMSAVAEGVSKESAIEQEQPKEPVTLAQTPATPDEDPAYQVVVKQLEVKAKRERTPTKTAKQKQDETVLAANLPVEITSKEKAYGEDLDKLAEVPQFTVDAFMEEFNQTIEKLAKTIPDKKGGPPQGYGAWDKKREQTAGELEAGRSTANQELKKHNKTHADSYCTPTVEKVSDQVLKENQALKSQLKLDPVGSTPTLQQARTAAAKPKTEKAISLDDQSRALDDALVGHNVGGRTIDIDETSLAFPISGEKSFDEAGETKRRAQQEILKAKPRYREQEKGVINKSEGEIHSLVNTTALQGHHVRRSESFKGVLDKQEHHKGNIKKGKVTAFSQFETVYQTTKRNVDAALKKIDPDAIENKLTPILTAAEAYFASSVRTRLEYIYTPGHFGLDYSDWIDEHAAEIATETEKFKNAGEDDIPAYLKGLITVQDRWAAKFFQDAKTIFIGTVKRGVEKEIAPMVVEALKEARNHIATGRADVQTAYDGLPESEKGQAKQVLEAVQGKFQSLEESVVEAQHEVITDMARTYNQSVGKLQSKFDEIKKDVLTSWLEKAWNKIKAVINAIIEFAKRILELLARIAGLAGDIISSPRAFFRNLGTGISEGFSTFVNRIDEFLATAFFDWLRGSSGVMVQLPKEWSAKGIFSLFTQLLNLSTETIWQRMEVVYDKTVANAFRRGEVLLDKGLEIFDIVKREGLGGLWDHIVESLGTLLSDTLDEMKETVLYAAIKKVFIEIGKMLIPGGGFIAIAEKIIRLVVFIVEARNKILDLIESFIASMENAVKGDIAGIVSKITGALTKFITVALDFLVAFFGLSDLKEKVERFIERMRSPIIRGIDFVLQKFKPLVMKGKELVVKGKEKVVGAVKAGAAAVLNWWENKKAFTTITGEKHTLLFEGEKQAAKLVVRTVETELPDLLRKDGPLHKSVETSGTQAQKASYASAMVHTKTVLVAKTTLDANADDVTAARKLNTAFLELVDDLIILGVTVQAEADLPTTLPKYEVDSTGKPVHVVAERLTKVGSKFSPVPQKDILGWEDIPETDETNWERTHVLSAELFGSNKQENLIVARRSTNRWFTTGPEEAGKRFRDGNAVIYYDARIGYHSPPPPEAVNFPARINITIGTMKKEGDAWKRERILLTYPPQTPSPPDFAMGPGGLPNLRLAGGHTLWKRGKLPRRVAFDIADNRPSGGYASLSALMSALKVYYAKEKPTSVYATTYEEIIDNAINNRKVEFV